MNDLAGGTVTIVEPGSGRIAVRLEGSEAILSELASSYPLKLLSPRLPPHNVAVVYILSYGGGLVAGDRVKLNVDVEKGAALVLLTQVCFSRITGFTNAETCRRDRQKSSRHDQGNVTPDPS